MFEQAVIPAQDQPRFAEIAAILDRTFRRRICGRIFEAGKVFGLARAGLRSCAVAGSSRSRYAGTLRRTGRLGSWAGAGEVSGAGGACGS